MGTDADEPPAPRAAATVVLMRDNTNADAVEVFLVQRHGKIGFMGGMHVFPGGKVNDEDRSATLQAYVRDHDAVAAHDVWGEGFDRDDAVALALAAIRETYEEAGVLLAVDAPAQAQLDAGRVRLNLGEASLSDLLGEFGAGLSVGRLTPFARWITPDTEPVRFDTAFYVAEAPATQRARHDEHETVSGDWYSPAVALDAFDAGELRLPPPTAQTLRSLSDVRCVADAHALARSRPPPVVLPLLRRVGDEMLILYPGDPEHPMAERALPGPTRRLLRRF